MKNLQKKPAKSLQMRELTKSEKRLLGILGIILVGWGSYQFIIMPQYSKLEAFSAQKVEYEDKIYEINSILSQEDSVNENLERLREEKDQLVSGYFPKLDQAQATYLLNDLLAIDEIEIVDMNFDRPTYVEFGEFQVKNMDISIPYEGTYDGVVDMIKSIQNSPRKIFIDRLSMDRDDEGNLRGNILLKIYGLDGLVDVETEEDVIVINTEKRALMSTPFTAYSSYSVDRPSTGEDDWWESVNPSTGNIPGDSAPSEGLTPYSPGFSVDYEKENEISFRPNEELK